MKTTFISTLSLWNSPRSAVAKLQADLAKANEEITTGRYADVGLELGAKTRHAISFRHERNELQALIDSNASITLRLNTIKTSLDDVRETADQFLAELAAVGKQGSGIQALQSLAKSNLNTLVDIMNRSAGGQYIFSGINTRQKPMLNYEDSAKAVVDTAFGLLGSPNALTAADIEAWLADGGTFASLFEDPQWSTHWSDASSENIVSKISPSEKVISSTNINEAAIRNLVKAYTMVSQLPLSELNPSARQVVIDKAVSIIGTSVSDLIKLQAQLGTAERKIADANERMDLQKVFFDETLGKLEGVDPAEAKTRVDGFMTQIQMSYSLTSQLRQLNLINFL